MRKTLELSSLTVKRLLFIFSAILLSLCTDTFLPGMGIRVYILPLLPLAASAAMFGHEFSGMLFGLLTGVLMDISSPITDGVLTLYMTLFGCICGLLTHYILRNTVITAVVLSAAGTALFQLIQLIFNCLSKDASAIFSVCLRSFLPTLLLTCLFSPVFYYAVRGIENKLSPDGDLT